jgi:hypothetical protein
VIGCDGDEVSRRRFGGFLEGGGVIVVPIRSGGDRLGRSSVLLRASHPR